MNVFGDFWNATNVTDFWRRWNPSMVKIIRRLHLKLRRTSCPLFFLFLINGMAHDLLLVVPTTKLTTGHFPKIPTFTIVFVAAFFTIYLEKKIGISKFKHPIFGRAYVVSWWWTLALFLGWLLQVS